MLAFGHEQKNAIGMAEEAAYRALSIDAESRGRSMPSPSDGDGKADEGIAFLDDHAKSWADRTIFIREHNYWHFALFHLDRDEPVRALQIFDEHLWGAWPEFAQEQIGAISALWRLEMRGTDVGTRWEPVVAKVVERWHEHILPFHDLHFVYAWPVAVTRAKRANFSPRWPATARRITPASGKRWRTRARRPCRLCRRPATKSPEAIGPVLPRLHLIGGSHTQRDVFVQTWIDASLRSGRYSAVAHVIDLRARTKPMEAARLQQLVAKAA